MLGLAKIFFNSWIYWVASIIAPLLPAQRQLCSANPAHLDGRCSASRSWLDSVKMKSIFKFVLVRAHNYMVLSIRSNGRRSRRKVIRLRRSLSLLNEDCLMCLMLLLSATASVLTIILPSASAAKACTTVPRSTSHKVCDRESPQPARPPFHSVVRTTPDCDRRHQYHDQLQPVFLKSLQGKATHNR
eukprot:SAG31_NODE_2170_length_6266_cov_7.557646_5_plen_187_part_00